MGAKRNDPLLDSVVSEILRSPGRKFFAIKQALNVEYRCLVQLEDRGDLLYEDDIGGLWPFRLANGIGYSPHTWG